MARFRKVTKSTIEAVTHLTAALRIWSCYRRLITGHFLAAVRRDVEISSREFGHWLQRGTHRLRAELGTARTPSRMAFSAASRGNLSDQRVPTHATSAAQSSSASTSGSASVLSVATTLDGGTQADVYNLSVEGAECYYANGILVHNCDCVTMAVARSREGFKLDVPADELDDMEEYEADARKSARVNNPRRLYGQMGEARRWSGDDDEDGAPATSKARRRLYGRM